MRRLPAWLLLLSLGGASALLPEPAEGQNLNARIIRLEGPTGTRTEDQIARGFNLLDCENPSDSWLVIAMTTGASAVSALDVWVGIGEQDCQNQSTRNPPSETCQHVGYIEIGSSVGSAPQPDSSLGPAIAIGLDAIEPTETVTFCQGSAPSKANFFVVANAENFRGETSSIDADAWAVLSVDVDSDPPAAPRIDRNAYQGGRQVTVDWGSVTIGGERQAIYQLYIEYDDCDPAGASGLLVPGERPPLPDEVTNEPDITYIDYTRAIQETSHTVSLTDLAIGESASVYVTATDFARNQSNLSEPICVTRLETSGFCAAWEDEEGSECPGACSTLAASPSSVLGLSAALSLLALASRRRRRSHR